MTDCELYELENIETHHIKINSNSDNIAGNLQAFNDSKHKEISNLLYESLIELLCEYCQFEKNDKTLKRFLNWHKSRIENLQKELNLN